MVGRDGLRAASRPRERQRARARGGEVGQQVGDLGGRGAPRPVGRLGDDTFAGPERSGSLPEHRRSGDRICASSSDRTTGSSAPGNAGAGVALSAGRGPDVVGAGRAEVVRAAGHVAGQGERGGPRVVLGQERGPGGVRAGQLGRLPQDERLATGGGGVGGDRGDVGRVDADQPGGARGGVGRGGGRQQERRRRTVGRGEPAQAAEHQADVRAEHPAERVALVDDDVPQRPEQPRPPPVLGQQREVQEVGVGQDDVGVLLHPAAFVEGGVAVAGGHPDVAGPAGDQEPVQGGELVGGEGLGRAQVQRGRASGHGLDAARVEQRPGARGAGGRQGGQPEREGLAGAGRRGQDGVPAGPGGVGGLDLVQPGTLDPEGAVALHQVGVRPRRPVRLRAGPRGQVPDVGHAVRATPGGEQHVEQRAGFHHPPILAPPGAGCTGRPRPARQHGRGLGDRQDRVHGAPDRPQLRPRRGARPVGAGRRRARRAAARRGDQRERRVRFPRGRRADHGCRLPGRGGARGGRRRARVLPGPRALRPSRRSTCPRTCCRRR